VILSYADPNRAKRLFASIVMAMHHGGCTTGTAPAPSGEPAAPTDHVPEAGSTPAVPPRNAALIAPPAPGIARLRFAGG
jgi:hypothetical protein